MNMPRFICVLLLILFTTGLPANIRAPQYLNIPPSGGLKSPSPGLVVKGEDLSFKCEAHKLFVGLCEIKAHYKIHSPGKLRAKFTFVLAGQAYTVQARVNAKDSDTGLKAVEQSEAEKQEYSRGGNGELTAPPFEATFQGELVKGHNDIIVTYKQPASYLEYDYAGCYPCLMPDQGKFRSRLVYLLWPLKEWKLDKDFRLNITVTVEQEEPGLFTRLFGSTINVELEGAGREADGQQPLPKLLPGQKQAQEAEYLKVELSLDRNFPDVLRILVGE